MIRPYIPLGFLLLAAWLCYGVVITSETLLNTDEGNQWTWLDLLYPGD